MFDREKQVVISKYCKSIFHDRERISVSDILKLNIPESIKHYIRLEVEKKVEEEFREIKNFSKFNFDHIRVKPLVDELKVLLALTKELNVDELSILLKFALDLNLDYLLKPCDTLTSFVMRYEEFQPSSVVIERLNYVVDYEYFPVLVKKYLEKKGLSRISKIDFLNLLYKIDKEYTKDFTILDHYNLFKRFKDFLSEINLSILNQAEYEAFIIYLKDKQQINSARFLEEHRDEFKSFDRDIDSFLKSILHSSIVEKKMVEQKVDEKEQVVEEKTITVEQISSYDLKEEKLSKPVVETETEHFEEEFSEKNLEQTKIEEPVTSSESTGFLPQELEEEISVPQKTYNRNLDGLMPKRLRKKVIAKIFNDDELDFVEFMEKLNAVNNWDEAALLLTDLFEKKNIQPYSKWAIKFTEFLYENIK